MAFGDSETCGPCYIRDRQRLEEELVTALQAQGHHIRKNAIGDHCVAGFVNIAKLAEALKRVVIEVTMMDHIEDLR
jgi:hypothetical protein